MADNILKAVIDVKVIGISALPDAAAKLSTLEKQFKSFGKKI